MHVWRIIREADRLYGVVQGDRCKSHQGGSHRKIGTTKDAKRNLEASRYDGSPQPIHIKVGQMWYVVLQAITQGRWIPVG
jgi:hypothetical protein